MSELELREQIADAILTMPTPTITPKLEDSWQMFLHVRNLAATIARGTNE